MNKVVTLEELALGELVLNLLLGVVLSTVVAWYYARFGEALSNRAKFAKLLPVLCLITILVISVIKSSLALSLGLVGALSIVRFRTAIKEPEELIYLFFVIAIGLGLGADQQIVTIVAAGMLVAVLVGTRLVASHPQNRNIYLNIQVPDGEKALVFEAVDTVLTEHAEFVDMRRLDRHDHSLRFTYFIRCKDRSVMVKLLEDLKETVPDCSFSFVDQKSVPGI